VRVDVVYLTIFAWWNCSTMYVETTWSDAFPGHCQIIVLTDTIEHLMCRSLELTKCVPALQAYKHASFTPESYRLSSLSKSCAYFSGSHLLGDDGCVYVFLCASNFTHIQLVYVKNN